MTALPKQAADLLDVRPGLRSQSEESWRYGGYSPYGTSGAGGGARRWPEGAWAAGYAKQPPAPLQVEKRRVDETAATIYAARPDMHAADGHVVVPPDACGLLVKQVPPGTHHDMYRLRLGAGRTVLVVAPPVEAGRPRWTQGVLYAWIEPSHGARNVDLHGYDFGTRKWVPLGGSSTPGAAWLDR